jgi:serine/threonine-protein kinase
VLKLLEQICGSLAEAHEAGLVHRDVKPANIMICARSGAVDVVKVLDFGLVKEMDRNDVGAHMRRSLVPDADPLKTEANVVMGTPLYLAPEAIRRRPVDARADLYAVGCVAYFLLTGTDAFAGPNLEAVLESHLERKPESPAVRLREVHGEDRTVPEDLEAIVLACLAKVPSDRPQTARALRELLLACADRATWSEEDARAWWAAKPALERATTELENAPTETLIIDWSSRVQGAAAAVGDVGPLSREQP